MTLRRIDFDYRDFIDGTSNVSAVFTNDGDGVPWSPYLTTEMTACRTSLVLTNGVNLNSAVEFNGSVDADGTISIEPLVLAVPTDPMFPVVSAIGAGRIRARGRVYRIRYRNLKTGKVSGMSPIPYWRLDLGMDLSDGTYLGQSCYFRIPSGASDVPEGVDAIDLICNSSNEETVWYVLETKEITGSYVEFTDDRTESEFLTNETADLNINPGFDDGQLPTFAKSFLHATGRLFLYGIRPMGVATGFTNGTPFSVAGANAFRLSTVTGTNQMFADRVGMSVRALSVDDPTLYEIVRVGADNRTLYVIPRIKEPGFGVTQFQLLDTRDQRLVWMSEPGSPNNYDPLNRVFIGFDRDDALLNIFAMNGRTYAQTKRHLYRLDDDNTVNPALSMKLVVIADEGTVGFRSGVVTPFGYCYLHPTLGVRVFDGEGLPRSLGVESPFEEFLPRTQFDGGAGSDTYNSLSGLTYYGFDSGFLAETLVTYDPAENFLHVFYVPRGSWSRCEELVFDPTTNGWRGPWRRGCATTGTLRNDDGSEVFAFGDDYGNLWLDQQQDVDMVNGGTGAEATSTLGGDDYVLLGSSFDATAQKQRGASVLLYGPSDAGEPAMQQATIVDVVDTSTLILDKPAVSSASTYKYRVGAIRWYARTAFLDFGEPILPKTLNAVRLRFRRGATGSSTATVGVLIDGEELGSDVTGENTTAGAYAPFSVVTQDLTYSEARIARGSRLFSVVFYGTNTSGDPQITTAQLDLRVEAGR